MTPIWIIWEPETKSLVRVVQADEDDVKRMVVKGQSYYRWEAPVGAV